MEVPFSERTLWEENSQLLSPGGNPESLGKALEVSDTFLTICLLFNL